MRHCVDDLEPGQTFTVLLNGENVSNRSIGFDTVEGWVDCYKLSPDGTIFVSKTYDTVVERLYGDVVVHLDPRDDKCGQKAHSSWIRRFFAGKRENE